MSGRIPPDRDGYVGYDCVEIEPLVVDCVDCDGNQYKRLPISLSGVSELGDWTDYREYDSEGNPVIPTTLIPDTFTHDCEDEWEQGFLETEYPDVAPVSVRGIKIQPSADVVDEKCGMFKTEKILDQVHIFDEDNTARAGILVLNTTVIEPEDALVDIPGDLDTTIRYVVANYSLESSAFVDFTIIEQDELDTPPSGGDTRKVIATIWKISGTVYLRQEHCGPIQDSSRGDTTYEPSTVVCSVSSKLAYGYYEVVVYPNWPSTEGSYTGRALTLQQHFDDTIVSGTYLVASLAEITGVPVRRM